MDDLLEQRRAELDRARATLAEIARLVAALPHGLAPDLSLGVSDEAVRLLCDLGATLIRHWTPDGRVIDAASLTIDGVKLGAQKPAWHL
jgi:hypothetical protein